MIVFFIAFLVIALIIAVWTSNIFRPALESSAYRAKCQLSVLQNANQGWFAYLFNSKVDCRTEDLTLKGDDAKEMQSLAKEMKSCWDAFGRGKLDLFQGDGVYCNVCSTIGFEEKGNLTGFKKYLSTAMATSQESYLQYLSGYENTHSDAVSLTRGEILKDDQIDKEKKYALVFVYAKGKDRVFSAFVDSLSLAAKINIITTGVILSGGNIYSATAIGSSAVISDASRIMATTATLLSPLGAPLMLYDRFMVESEWVSFIQLSELTEQNLNSMGCQMPVNTA